MEALDIQIAISQRIIIDSGLDQHRDYLGISKVADCPRKTTKEFLQGIDLSEPAYRMCYAGYHQERDVFKMLVQAGVAQANSRGMEVVAPFDAQLKGHIDGLTMDGHLLEIKSITLEKYRSTLEKRRVLFKHFCQIAFAINKS